MTDRGDTIVALARELLSEECALTPPVSKQTAPARTYALAAGAVLGMILSAAGGVTYSQWGSQWGASAPRLINHYERTQIEALIFYAAKLHKLNQDALRQEVLEHCAKSTLSEMTQADFEKARHYLQKRIDR